MKPESPLNPAETRSGCRKLTSTREWLQYYAVIGPLVLVTMMGLNAVCPLLLHREPLLSWPLAISQALFIPLGFLGLAMYQERRILARRPRLRSGPHGKIEILNKLNGNVVATVPSESLRNAVFTGMDLRAVSLWGEDLAGANLSGSNLYGACLRGAILDGADLSRANLRSANLIGASLRNADLRGADLRDALARPDDLTGAIYDSTTQWGVNAASKRRHCINNDQVGSLPVPASPPLPDNRTLPRPTEAVMNQGRNSG